ncbi:glycosyltransferase [Magnetospirillum molischianum]|uniref:Glycosyl transferase, group 1 n=1 Tax=Magnetospirillum molischianum DSM 120 TaxID=1150626 RepID=H8FQD1_MAGML|nr:glycosyltransferase [Magnetospirillum molischianum]CCG40569.1 Glycosyl transferase, group 1 [Magnetospirillum molischianum DSM 120]
MKKSSSEVTILHIFPTFDVGGSQVRFAQLANHFGSRYHHLIMAMDGRHGCAPRLSPDLHVTLLEPDWRRGDMLSEIVSCHRKLDEIRPDILATYNWGAMDWAIANQLARRPHLHIEDGFGPDEATNQIPRRIWTRRLILRRSKVVLPSQTLLGIATTRWRLPPHRLRYIPNGIDTARFASAPDPAFSALLPVGDGPVIGSVATLRPEKRLDRLLRAFRLTVDLTPARLVIVGDGSERTSLEHLAAELGIADKVLFAGHWPDPARVTGAFDIIAVSSDTEQMPYSVLEGMAAGKPVAATDVGDIATMVARENRSFLSARTDTAFATVLTWLSSNAPLRAYIGAANRQRALQHYDQAGMFVAYADIFDSMTPHGRAAISLPTTREAPL